MHILLLYMLQNVHTEIKYARLAMAQHGIGKKVYCVQYYVVFVLYKYTYSTFCKIDIAKQNI